MEDPIRMELFVNTLKGKNTGVLKMNMITLIRKNVQEILKNNSWLESLSAGS